VRPGRNATEIVVAALDRRALFADLALAIARAGGNVVGARIFTSTRGEALDVFFVQTTAGEPFGKENPRALERLLESLEQAGRGERGPREPPKNSPASRPSPFTIPPIVTIDNEASDDATVIEASGRDRPGLLEALARTLADADLSIQSAHIDGYGERAVDSFYVVTPGGTKLIDPALAAEVREGLAEVLDAEPAGRSDRLARARASQAR